MILDRSNRLRWWRGFVVLLFLAGGALGLLPSCHTPAPPPANATTNPPTDHPSDPAENSRPARPEPAEADPEPSDDAIRKLLPAGSLAENESVRIFTDHDELFAADRLVECAIAFERLRRVFPPRTTPLPVRVLIYGTNERYRAYADLRAPENADVLGYYDPLRREVVTTFTGSEAALFSTLLHECAHLVLRDHLGTRFLPPWLDEGLASCYETGRIDEVTGELVFGRLHPVYVRVVRENLAEEKDLHLRKLASMGFGLFSTTNRPQLHQNYAVAWSLIYYMLHGERGMYHPTLQLYLSEISAAPDSSTRYGPAFDTVFGPRMETLVAGWAAWARTAGQ